MRFRHLLEAERKKMGRDLNHLEDLVLFYGSDGAQEAIDILRDLTSDSHDISIKWDGKVAIFYGRDENGDFMMGTKGNWAKKTPLRSPQEASDYITQGGNGEDWRQAMGQAFNEIFPLLDASVPVSFKGFVTGDLIYSPVLAPKQDAGDAIAFTSNQVTYKVKKDSEVGKRVAETTVGVALHIRFSEWGSGDKAVISDDTVKQLNSSDVLAFGQTYAAHAPKLDDTVVKKLEQMKSKYGKAIDSFIEPKKGMSDIPQTLYTYNNQMVRQDGEASVKTFFDWLPNSKVSAGKQAKYAALLDENPEGFGAIFELFNAVGAAKNNIISQLDNAEADIIASTHGEAGGEGYVSLKNKVKLVPRSRWKPS